MIVKHIPIEVTSKQVGKPVVGEPGRSYRLYSGAGGRNHG